MYNIRMVRTAVMTYVEIDFGGADTELGCWAVAVNIFFFIFACPIRNRKLHGRTTAVFFYVRHLLF